ncbi:feather beta keratin-like [Oenanthe melanoleuca]|uniref:feather beta keratin-like n=1 Tax=Oenanthe melanoleuca TaxID=2939378 RepID=UPI0024C0EAD8|nr:feather beta keratin-like [Oenanthe melanoleuca]
MPQGHRTRLSRPYRTSIKGNSEPFSLTHFSSHTSRTLHTTPMACNSLCRPCGPTPLANSCNEPCALQCQDSRVIINPSPVLVTLPGPIMTSFPQSTAVGSTSSAAVGTELSVQGQPISGGFGGFGYGLGYGCGFGYGLGCGYGRRGGYIC